MDTDFEKKICRACAEPDFAVNLKSMHEDGGKMLKIFEDISGVKVNSRSNLVNEVVNLKFFFICADSKQRFRSDL